MRVVVAEAAPPRVEPDAAQPRHLAARQPRAQPDRQHQRVVRRLPRRLERVGRLDPTRLEGRHRPREPLRQPQRGRHPHRARVERDRQARRQLATRQQLGPAADPVPAAGDDLHHPRRPPGLDQGLDQRLAEQGGVDDERDAALALLGQVERGEQGRQVVGRRPQAGPGRHQLEVADVDGVGGAAVAQPDGLRRDRDGDRLAQLARDHGDDVVPPRVRDEHQANPFSSSGSGSPGVVAAGNSGSTSALIARRMSSGLNT